MSSIPHNILRALYICVFLAMLPASVHADDSVYRDFGEKPGLTALVEDFMSIVLTDARISASFANSSVPRIKLMLVEQFCELTGGPCKYPGKEMKSSHASLGVTNGQFNALAEDLQIAMDKAKIPFRAQNKLLAKLAPMQRDIVTK